jgi:tRNA dimethylallyltransferase
MKTPKIPLIIIVGPTATGKSDLAMQIAKKVRGEVISADSRQVYRELDIGTGKITEKEMKGVPHHLLDIANSRIPANSPERYSVEQWRTEAAKIITEIHARGNVPIIAGGTGFYIESLVEAVSLPDVPPNSALRKKLGKKSADGLFKMLKKMDPARAKKMLGISGDWQNPRRIIRAIEVATALGKVPALTKTSATDSPYAPFYIGLTLSPAELQKKIAARLTKRIKQGMIDEAKKLHKKGLSLERMNELGLEYRYLAYYLQGLTKNKKSENEKKLRKEMIDTLNTEIWHYAKRQIGWFQRNRKIKWFHPKKAPAIVKIAEKFVKPFAPKIEKLKKPAKKNSK